MPDFLFAGFARPALAVVALPLLVTWPPTSCSGQEPDSLEKPPVRTMITVPAKVDVPPGYFLFPIKPGKPNYLSGSMGELRPNHFHGGLDIKTDGRVGLPVYASADGYVSRLKQSSYGYGNVLYITHPNGLTTVYGHLNRFKGPVAAELLRQQYAKQTYDLELFFKPGQFPVKRGEVVALSGNTGGSAGPHLHWEVRTAEQHQLNPLQWGGFAEIQDHVPPVLQAFAVEPLGIEARVQGKFNKAVFVPKTGPLLGGGGYIWPDTIAAYGTVGLLLQGFDRFDGMWNKNGIQRITVQVNGRPHYEHVIDNVPFPEGSRQINGHIDYEWRATQGRQLEKLFVDDGNTLSMYRPSSPGKGRLRVQAGQLYSVEIVMADSYGNRTPLRFVLRGEQPGYFKTRSGAVKQPDLRYEVRRNLLVAVAADPDSAAAGGRLLLYRGRRRLKLRPSYTVASESTYLYDLRAGLPDSLSFRGITRRFDRQALIPSGQDFSFSTSNLQLGFSPVTLFDTLYVQTDYHAGVWTVHHARTPLYQTLRLTLRPEVPPADPRRTAIYGITPRGGKAYVGGQWAPDNTTVSAPIKAFGRFRILTDTIPPSARLVSRGPGGVVFKVGDDLSGLASYKFEVGGRFRLLRFEHKNATLYTERQDNLGPPLRGPATLRLTDQAGNERVLKVML